MAEVESARWWYTWSTQQTGQSWCGGGQRGLQGILNTSCPFSFPKYKAFSNAYSTWNGTGKFMKASRLAVKSTCWLDIFTWMTNGLTSLWVEETLPHVHGKPAPPQPSPLGKWRSPASSCLACWETSLVPLSLTVRTHPVWNLAGCPQWTRQCFPPHPLKFTSIRASECNLIWK